MKCIQIGCKRQATHIVYDSLASYICLKCAVAKPWYKERSLITLRDWRTNYCPPYPHPGHIGCNGFITKDEILAPWGTVTKEDWEAIKKAKVKKDETEI